MPNINEILLKLEGFQYAMSLDLRMVYYQIQFIEEESNICMIIIPWGKYYYKCLPMVVYNSPQFFQQKMNDFFKGFYFIHVYLY